MAKQLNESQRGLQVAPGEVPTAEDVLQTQPAVPRNSSLGQLWATSNSTKIQTWIVGYHSCPRKIYGE